MKCYIDISNEFQLSAYTMFLEDTFMVSFKVKHQVGEFVCLESESNKFNSYLLIRGENINVINLLMRLPINEKNIILISCTATLIITVAKKYNQSLTKNKTIYYSEPEKNSLTTVYSGKEFGLEFDPVKSEYMLGRNFAKMGLYDCLDKYFHKKKVKEC